MKSEFLDKSICVNCEYLNKRLIEIQDLGALLEDMGICLDEDEYAEDGVGIVMESFICKYLNIELDHYVLECDSYTKKLKKNIMKNKKILGDIS